MKKINTALCSFGMSGKVFHAPFLDVNPGFHLYAVWERSSKTAEALYPGIKSFDTLEAMLADEAIELVVVNTPNYTHFEFTKKALLAGKHVLVEKAFTVTVSEAEELIKIAEEQHKKLAVYQNRRYDSDFRTVKKIKEEGVLGDIVEAEFHFDRFNLNLSPKKHKETTNPGSGLLHDLGPHIIDQAVYLFGKPDSVFGEVKIQRPGSQVNDYFDIHLFYPSLSVRLKASLIVKEQPAAYALHGTHGSFLKNRGDIQEDVLKKGIKPGGNEWGIEAVENAGILNTVKDGKETRITIPTLQGNYMDFYDELYTAIAHEGKLPVSAEDGLQTIRIIEAVLESHTSQKVVAIS